MYTIENSCLSAVYQEADRQLIITDKRISKVWKQQPFPACMELLDIRRTQEENGLLFTFGGEMAFTMSLTLNQAAELLYVIHAAPDSPMEELAFPPAISAPDAGHYILETDSEGLLLPVNDNGYPLGQEPVFRCSGGPAMPWLGMVDPQLEAGYMSIYETPFDADILLEKADGMLQFSTVWQSSLGKFSYDRKIRTIFFDRGGYVAQCKRYRAYAWEKNKVTTLCDRLKRFPAMEKMLGAVHIYVWDDARQKEFLEELKESGIDRALILWNPNHLPYPEKDFTAAAKELGYGVGGQELFTDIHPDTPQRLERKRQIPLLLNCFPGKFEFLTAKTENGGTYSNQFGTYICPAAVREEIKNRLDLTLKDYPQETFLWMCIRPMVFMNAMTNGIP